MDRRESQQAGWVLTSNAGTVFLTGGTGLLALNWAMTVRDRQRVVLGLHDRVVSLSGVETQLTPLDSVDAIVRALQAVGARLVVHTAGLTSVERCEADPSLAQHVNVELAGNVAAATHHLGLQLVHISTDHLFSGEQAFVDEKEPVAPRNVYARTKAAGEMAVLAANPTALVIRTNFYAWGTSYRPSFSDYIIGSLRAGRPITLFEDVHYTPILVEPLVHAVHEMVEQQVTGIFHVTGDDRISKADFGNMIAERFGLDAGLIRIGRLSDTPVLVRRPYDMSLSNAAVRSVLGRSLGGSREQIARLWEQERTGYAREMQSL